MEHGLELIIARLEILEIEVCNISYKPRDIGNLSFSTSSYPGNIGNLSFSTSSYPGNIGKRIFFNFLISWKQWIVRSILSPILERLEISVWIGDMSGCVYNLCFAVEPPRRGFFSAKNSISLIFGHVLSQEIALFLDFGPYLVLFEPY